MLKDIIEEAKQKAEDKSDNAGDLWHNADVLQLLKVNEIITETAQIVAREVSEKVEEWCVHNAKTIHHNNGYREYIDVRELLELLNTLQSLEEELKANK
jgi:hypothetical protein